MAVRIRCHNCRETFPWDFAKNGYPDECKKCGEFIGGTNKDPIAIPYISTAKKRGTADQVYRAMEKGSEYRAEVAAEMLGTSVVDQSGLKITNLRDNQREGDIAAVPVNNEVTRAMAAAPAGLTGYSNPHAVQLSQGTRAGPLPNAGTNFIQNVLKPRHGATWGAPITDNPSIGVRPR